MTRLARRLVPVPMLVAILVVLTPSAARGGVTVQKKPMVVERKTFDPNDKPAEMPPLSPSELAVTSSQFDCATEVQIVPRRSKARGGKHTLSYTVHGVKVVLQLKVVIWNPANAAAKLKAHEEGHREISETIYKAAEVHAKAAAQKLDGRRIVGEGDTPAAAQKAADEALQAANRQVCEEYMDLTSRAGVRVQNLYDELTGHGTRPLGEKEAVEQAFAKDAEEQKKQGKPPALAQPATKPARRP
jgi:hypothetical protein